MHERLAATRTTRTRHRRRGVALVVASVIGVLVAPGTASPRPRAAAPRVGCTPATPSTCTLRELADLAGIRFGATLEPDQIADAPYADTLVREFSAVTAENAMKWYTIGPTPGTRNFAPADAVLAFADAHQQQVRGHNLVWAQDAFTPAWIRETTDPAALRTIVEDHITAVLDHYRGRIERWDVVNEPLASVGSGRSNSVFDRVLGPDWLADVYRHAHEVDPDVELWLNEYGSDWVPGKHEALLSLLRGLLDDGVPLDGIGLQTHRLSVDGPDRAQFQQQLRDYAALGLKVAITELDVAVRPTDPTGLDRQADAYATVVASCLAVPACEEVTLWGVTDRYTWLDAQGILPAPTRPLLFDGQYQPKPAYGAVRDVLAGGRAEAAAWEPPASTTTTTSAPTVTETTASASPTTSTPAPAVPVAASPSFTG